MLRTTLVLLALMLNTLPVCAGVLPEDVAGADIAVSWAGHQLESWKNGSQVAPVRSTAQGIAITNTGPDPNIAGPRVRIDTNHFKFIAIRMRSNVPGQNQLYFGTVQRPGLAEGRTAFIEVLGDNQWHWYQAD